jgi:hypothetical protein
MHAHLPRRRRSCAGCLFHHPLTVGLTFVAVILWLGQFVQAGIALAAGQPPDLLAMIQWKPATALPLVYSSLRCSCCCDSTVTLVTVESQLVMGVLVTRMGLMTFLHVAWRVSRSISSASLFRHG